MRYRFRGLTAIAGVLALSVTVALGVGTSAASGLTAAGGECLRTELGRQGRGQAQPDRLGGLRPARVGQALREVDGLPGERQVRGLVQ